MPEVVRLELGRWADSAIRAAMDLASHHGDGERRKARAISVETGVPARARQAGTYEMAVGLQRSGSNHRPEQVTPRGSSVSP